MRGIEQYDQHNINEKQEKTSKKKPKKGVAGAKRHRFSKLVLRRCASLTNSINK